jgi:hypothetical protein
VLVNGEIVMQDRTPTRHDEKQILTNARLANRDLVERISKLSF